MNASALVRSPLKTSGSSTIGLALLARGWGRRLAGRLGPAGGGSPPGGRPPGGPGAGSPPPPPPPPPPPSPARGGPLPSPNGLHSAGWLLSPSSVRLSALSKLVVSFSCILVLVWVTIAGGLYCSEYCLVQAAVGGGSFS